jgi:hypothetical protein
VSGILLTAVITPGIALDIRTTFLSFTMDFGFLP